MKRVLIFLLIFLILPLASAEIIITSQINEVYNLGDSINVPATIKTASGISGIFNMDIICNGRQENFYKNGVNLIAGEEKKFEASLVLTLQVIGELKGNCKIKAFIGEDFVLTKDFKISDSIKVTASLDQTEFNPGENLITSGEATKENGKAVNGYVDLSITEGNISILSQMGTVSNGFFSIDIPLPENVKAGAYLLKLDIYEKDTSGETTNKGLATQNIRINQIPTNLEIVLETKEIEPGTNLNVKTILRDQTGEKIPATSQITIKNSKDKIIDRIEIETDELLDFPISYNQLPEIWKIEAISNKMKSETTFTIIEKESIEITIKNRTVTITNTGNVVYDNPALIKIGNDSISIDVYLEVNGEQKYLLTAPDGHYDIEIITDKGTSYANVALTGKAVDVKKASSRLGIFNYSVVWVFVILILGFVLFIVFRKGYQKTFIGYIGSKIPKKSSGRELVPLAKKSLVKSSNKAELSLSIKGDKQTVSVLAVHIKNLKENQSKEGNIEETLQKIVDSAEQDKAVTYENASTLFFIFAPARTKTFKNERTALEKSRKIKDILDEHNKKFKQKINFGISINYGTIVAKQDPGSFKFMSLGTLMNSAKKIASLAEEEILLEEKIKEKLSEEIKTEKHSKGKMNVYSIKEVKDSEGNKRFIKSFLERIEGKDDEKK